MSETILAALIGAVASIVVCLINNAHLARKREVEEAVKEERLNNRLTSIEHKLDTHNGYAEKIGGIRDDMAKISTDIAVITTKIEESRKGDRNG